MDLSTLVKMSNTYGSNPAYVLAGGGNTSVKDDTTLYVKGSGTQLATIKAEEFVEMSRARLNEIMKTDYPEDDVKRESLYLADVMAAVTDADKTNKALMGIMDHRLFFVSYQDVTQPLSASRRAYQMERERLLCNFYHKKFWTNTGTYLFYNQFHLNRSFVKVRPSFRSMARSFSGPS